MTTPAGLYNKYQITRTDGQPLHPEFEGFVLRLDEHGDPAHVAACRQAVLAYAKAIEKALPQLALDIVRRWQPVPEGWEHYIGDDYLKFLVDKAVLFLIDNRPVHLFASSIRLSCLFQDLLNDALWSHPMPHPSPSRMKDLFSISIQTGWGLRFSSPFMNNHCVLVDNPLSSSLAMREGDVRKMINKLQMTLPSCPPPALISASRCSWHHE